MTDLRFFLFTACFALLACGLNAEPILLKSGDRIEGDIVRTEGDKVTIRTPEGFSTYHIRELDQAWVDEHTDRLFTTIKPQPADSLSGAWTLLRALFGKESLSQATPFLLEHRAFMLPMAFGLIAVGLVLCFFGWKLFKFSTILNGIVGGIAVGLALGSVLAASLGSLLPEKAIQAGTTALSLAIGIPLAIAGALLGRRFAMFGARINTLAGKGVGGIGCLLALTHFAYFDLSIIWGHSLLGALLITTGGYCAAVMMLDLPDAHLQTALLACLCTALVVCIVGSTTQIKALRSTPPRPYRGEY